MTKNEGKVDRIVRGLAGVVGIGVAVALQGAWWILGAVGAVLLVTGVTGFCGLYTLLGVSTCPVKQAK